VVLSLRVNPKWKQYQEEVDDEYEYVYDGATIEEIITSHDTHDNYNSLRVWYRGDELNLKELEIIVFQEEEA